MFYLYLRRSIITMSMCLADLFAAFLRSILWINGKLDALQQVFTNSQFRFPAICIAKDSGVIWLVLFSEESFLYLKRSLFYLKNTIGYVH